MRLLLRGGVDLNEYSFLEQQDFLEFERKEQTMRFVEQAIHIYATARDAERAKKLVDRLKDELFIGHTDMRAARDKRLSDELLKAVHSTYSITTAGGAAILEMGYD